MLMHLTPVRSGTSNCALSGEHYASTPNTAGYSMSVLNGVIRNAVHDLRNMLTSLNSGVRMLVQSTGQECREVLFGGLYLSAANVLKRAVVEAPGEGEAS